MLFPAGAESVEDIHWDLAFAIEHANTVLTWQHNLAKNEMPPRWMWPFPDELTIWFEEVEANREKSYSSDGGGNGEHMEINQLAKAGVRQKL
jgi:hypothetical protein